MTMTKGDGKMIVKQPDHTLREGYRLVEVIGLPGEPFPCRRCGYPNDPSLDDCHGCGVDLAR